MTSPEHYWHTMDQLLADSQIIIDRPKGSAHPRFPDFIYPLDYGYLAGTLSPDQDGIDVWVGSLPDRRVSAVITTVDMVKRDAEVKILVACTRLEAEAILKTHNEGPQAAILWMREEINSNQYLSE